MKVSAIIPAFNRRAYIGRAIDSILAQTVQVDEIVVIDDGSTDGTADLVTSRYGSQVRLIRQQNTGVAGARRRGIQEARGEWIAFLDSDDEWMPAHNAKLLEAAAVVPPEVAWIFGDLDLVTDHGSRGTLFQTYGLHLSRELEIISDSLAIQYPFQFCMFQGSLIRRDVLLRLECFTEGLRSDDDLLAGFQVACHYKFAAINTIVGKYFRTSDLDASSVVVNGNRNPDCHRSRMIAFAGVIRSGRRYPWNLRYAAEARALCQMLAERRSRCTHLALEQFRYGGFSAKGVAFACFALAGGPGVRMWNRIAAFRRTRLANSSSSPSTAAHRAYFQSFIDGQAPDVR